MSRSLGNIFHIFRRLWHHLRPRRRTQLVLLLVLMVFTAFAEIFSLGAVFPFLSALTNPDLVYENQFVQPILKAMGITSPNDMLLPLTLAFCSAALLAGTMRLMQIWANTRIAFAAGADLSVEIYKRTLYQSYAIHVARNSSTIIDAVVSKVNLAIFSVIDPTLNMITAIILMVSIMATLIIINPIIAVLSFSGFGLTYGLIVVMTRRRLKQNSNIISKESRFVVKTLQEGLGGIRDVLIDGNQAEYCKVYSNAVFPLRRAQGNNLFIRLSPRLGIEAIGMIFIASVAYWLSSKNSGVTSAIPVIGAFALGAQRLLPLLQQIYGGWSSVQGSAASIKVLFDLLEQPLTVQVSSCDQEELPFNKLIVLNDISFRYSTGTSEVLSNIDLEIPKGGKVGFIGATGSGKSTLLDVVMGLLRPTKGTIEVDGTVITPENQRSWQQHIAHVPQTIFLSDMTIEENIALGVPKTKINHERVHRAAMLAELDNLIESWPEKYQTVVGERGVSLSGGQRQRIGIARALYKQADVIIFDEATSALDTKTESAVMQNIEQLHGELTMLIIAHRLTTLRSCDIIVELDNGKIHKVGTYEEIVG